MNTQEYAIEVSEDGTEYTQVALVKGNTEGATSNAFAPGQCSLRQVGG